MIRNDSNSLNLKNDIYIFKGIVDRTTQEIKKRKSLGRYPVRSKKRTNEIWIQAKNMFKNVISIIRIRCKHNFLIEFLCLKTYGPTKPPKIVLETTSILAYTNQL